MWNYFLLKSVCCVTIDNVTLLQTIIFCYMSSKEKHSLFYRLTHISDTIFWFQSGRKQWMGCDRWNSYAKQREQLPSYRLTPLHSIQFQGGGSKCDGGQSAK